MTNGTKGRFQLAFVTAILSISLTAAAFLATAGTLYVDETDDVAHWTQHIAIHAIEMELQKKMIEQQQELTKLLREELKDLKEIIQTRFWAGG